MSLPGSSVLITGGTGSWGHSAVERFLCMPNGPSRIAILSRDEVKQSQMRQKFSDPRLRFFIGDVRDLPRLQVAFRGMDIVFHAAAMKRIEVCAYNPTEAIRTNIKGSVNVLRAAETCGVSKVIALSSDKACAPSTTYGATKLCMEHVFTASTAQANHKPACCVLRYGNVAGSRGSVIPLWRQEIAAGNPVLVFDPASTRFWFTLQGAVDFALWAVEHATGGELFVPALDSFRIVDLARAMDARVIDAQPLVPRPGEKRHESMVSQDEAPDFRVWEGKLCRFQPGDTRGEPWPGDYYSSETGPHMTVEELRKALEEV